MPSYPGIYVPAIAVAHLLAFALGLYSIEKSLGLITKVCKRFGIPLPRHKAEVGSFSNLCKQHGSKDESKPAARGSTGHTQQEDKANSTGLQSRKSTDWDSSREARSLTHITSAAPGNQRAPRWLRVPDREVGLYFTQLCCAMFRSLSKRCCLHNIV